VIIEEGYMSKTTINIGGDVTGGIQVDTSHSQQNIIISNNDSIDKIIGQIIDAVKASSLTDYDKDEAVHDLQQLQKLSKQEKTPDVIDRAKKKLELFQSAVKAGTDLGAIISPYLPLIAQWFI
jgi:hypothetical protein